jgi:hypothetical protein
MAPTMKPVLRVADLASKLGTEVRWNDPTGLPAQAATARMA